jgi:hypothetical protein
VCRSPNTKSGATAEISRGVVRAPLEDLRRHALFDAKGVDWNALYRVYRTKVSATTTDDGLFQILSDLLGHLNDNHVTLTSKTPVRFFSAGYLYKLFSGTSGGADAYVAFEKMMAERPVPRKYFVKGLQEAGGPAQFTKTILLLTDQTSVSAAENFALAMKVLPHVVQVGDFASGCFADAAAAELPNGWSFSYSYNLFMDRRGFCWEGIALPPEIRQINAQADVRQDKDPVFELAVAIIASGGLESK